MVSEESVLPFCPVCNKPVPLETAQTDDNGRAIHGDCYALILSHGRREEPSDRPH